MLREAQRAIGGSDHNAPCGRSGDGTGGGTARVKVFIAGAEWNADAIIRRLRKLRFQRLSPVVPEAEAPQGRNRPGPREAKPASGEPG
jgi:hypothetical protein